MSSIQTPMTSSSTPNIVQGESESKEQKSSIPKNLLLAITELLQETMVKTSRKKSKIRQDIFYSRYQPQMSVLSYLQRIANYTHIESSTLILSVICMNSFLKKIKNFLSPHNVHRLLLTSILINAKFHEDYVNSINFFSKVGGVSEDELKKMEYEFYTQNDFNLLVSNEIFDQYLQFFNAKAKKFQKEASL